MGMFVPVPVVRWSRRATLRTFEDRHSGWGCSGGNRSARSRTSMWTGAFPVLTGTCSEILASIWPWFDFHFKVWDGWSSNHSFTPAVRSQVTPYRTWDESSVTKSKWSCWAASFIGVEPSAMVASGSPPAASNTSVTSACPSQAALCNGVHP